MMENWNISKIPGGYPPCFFLPENSAELWHFSTIVNNAVYIWKPAGAWGGRGIIMTRNIRELLQMGRAASFEPIKDGQCYGL